MRKLTFEKACFIVFILIVLISTSDMTGKYIDKYIDKYKNNIDKPIGNVEPSVSSGFPTTLMNADKLYVNGNYAEAAEAYLSMTLNTTLTLEQKAHANFRLGVCQYYLKNYDRAVDSFIKSASFSPDDSVAYNNAAVSAYMKKNLQKAIELESKALSIMPAVEYYYNIARIYEDNNQYELAADNFYMVAVGEHQITKIDSIDPVRIKEKVARLSPNVKLSDNKLQNNILRVYKLGDNREILTVNDNEMQLRQGDFVVKVENQKSSKAIVAEYDREKFDPYNLISELLWTVYKDGKAIYKRSSDQINIKTTDTGTYEVALNIKYNGNKEKVSKKIVRIYPSNTTVVNDVNDVNEVITQNKPLRISTKTYEYALYEQLFESEFQVSNTGYVDKYNVLWGTDDIPVSITKQSRMDKSSSLIVENTSYKKKGIWVILDSLLHDEKNKDRRVTVSFYSKKISPNASINMIIRIKSNNVISMEQKNFVLDSEWAQNSVSVFIPKEATGFTITLTTSPKEQFYIDRFVIVD